uniref:Amsh n=1 Tax=Rhizophora mucronata TaxID=61149 RepID=A0A2P2M3D1_RHIMU
MNHLDDHNQICQSDVYVFYLTH